MTPTLPFGGCPRATKRPFGPLGLAQRTGKAGSAHAT
jgi:hypothetical protein